MKNDNFSGSGNGRTHVTFDDKINKHGDGVFRKPSKTIMKTIMELVNWQRKKMLFDDKNCIFVCKLAAD